MEYISLLLGVASLGLSIVFYVFAGRDLRAAVADMKRETTQLQNLNRITLEALQNAGFVKLNRDANGTIIGMHHDLQAHLGGTTHASGELTLTRIPAPDDPELGP